MKKYCLLLCLLCLPVATQAALPGKSAIASAHPLATAAGFEIIAQGGNAFDAAVAVSAALAVVEPYSSGLGGGGFWLLHRGRDGKQVMLDGREMAPARAQRDMYLDKQGEVIPQASVDGPLAAGIPGVPAALQHLAQHYGKLTLQQSLAPAIRYAREGFAVEAHYRRMAGLRRKALRASPEAAAIFLQDNDVPPLGQIIKQPDLAATLEAIAHYGAESFYRGEIAQRMVTANRDAGGIWSLADLAGYRVVEREPLTVQYKGMRIVSVAPPSSGGVALAEMLNMLGPDVDISRADGLHRLIEVMRRAYRDRAEYLGDTDVVSVPVVRLMSAEHARAQMQNFTADNVTQSSQLRPVNADTGKGTDTTHFSIIDSQGNRVAATLSVNFPFGSGFVARGTGVILNDEMDDFSAKPGVPNVYGLVGNEANAIAPFKRPLSSMSPSFIESERGVAVLGTPGGSRIISMLLLGILDYARGGDASSMVSRPRLHHQYLPDLVRYEPGALNADVYDELILRGHFLDRQSPWGNMQVVLWERASNSLDAASDPRGLGQADIK
jgi:gamma-glutamyltranspeptidase/glutathione hydrolase